MSIYPKLNARGWIVVAVAVIAITGHGFVLYLFSSHVKLLSGAVVAAIIAVVVVKHLGIAAPLVALLRKRLGK